MDYIGSKVKLNKWIFDTLSHLFPDPKQHTFLDACCGSGAVSQYAASIGYKVISTDCMKFPSVIINGSIGLTKKEKHIANQQISELNKLSGIKGYFYKNFCDESSPSRMYFTAKNAQCIDHVRSEIEKIDDPKIKDYLLYCGLEAMSRVSNTTGVQAAYLKKFKDRARGKLTLREEQDFKGKAKAFCCDILELLKKSGFRKNHTQDVLYIDPPYNHRQYGPNYHLYETFVRNDNPKPSGKTGLRNWKEECSSQFCSKKGCLKFLMQVIEATTAKIVLISYNSDGILTKKDMRSSFRNVKVHERLQRRYKADTAQNRVYNQENLVEYLFEIHL